MKKIIAELELIEKAMENLRVSRNEARAENVELRMKIIELENQLKQQGAK